MWHAVGRLRSSPTAMLLLAGSGWSLCVQILSKLSILISLAAWARVLDVENLGLLVSLQAIGLLATTLWDAGFSPMLMRDVAAYESELTDDLKSAVVARATLSPLSVLAFVVGCFAIGVSGRESILAAVVVGFGALVGGLSLLLNSGIQAHLKFRMGALTTSMGRVLVALLSVTVAWVHPPMPLVSFALAYLAGELVILVAQYRSIKPSLLPNIGFPSVSSALQRQGQALPYALNSLFVMVYNRMDVVLLTWFAGTYQAGIFAPASRLQDALIFIPTTASAAIIPVAAGRLARTGDSVRMFRTGLVAGTISVALTVPMLIAVFLAARPVITKVLGQEYLQSADAIRIIVWSLVFIAIAQPFFSIVIAAGRAVELNLAYGIALVIALVGHSLLDARFGAVGAAWVAVIRDAAGAFVGVSISIIGIKKMNSSVGTAQVFRRVQ